MTDELEDLLAEFVARRENGEALEPERFAAEHPDAGAALVDALRMVAVTEAAFPSATTDTAPKQVGAYRVLAELGRGGMGRVLEVESAQRPGHVLALKLISAAASLNPRAVERLRREGEVLRRLQHPGIVGVREVGVFDGAPYLVIDRLHGASLAAIVAAARESAATGTGPRCSRLALPGAGDGPRRVARCVAKIARAVAAAHGAGVLHRDIKPGNVIATTAGEVVLIDFGLAAGESGPTLTKTGDVLGTPHYMAPEQARGEHATERTDVYGLGAVLYELLTLQPPHPGDDSVAVLDAVRRTPVARPRRLDRALPVALDTIVRRATAFEPRYRYAAAADFAADLEAFVAGGAIAARPPAFGQRLVELRRFHGRAIAIGAGVAVVAALAAALIVGSQPTVEARLVEPTARAAAAWIAGDLDGVAAAGRRIAAIAPDGELGDLLVRVGERRELQPLVTAGLRELGAGLQHHAAKDMKAATQAFKGAAEAMPGSPLAAVMLGAAARAAGELQVAEVQLATAARLLPDSADVRRELGRTLRAQERFDEAVAALQDACALAADDAHNWQELARVHLEAGQLEPGLVAIERAIALQARPSGRDLQIKGLLLERQKRFVEARGLYRELIDRRPDHEWAWEHFAWTFDSTHEMVAAEREYLALVERMPDNPMGPMSLAYLYSGSNRERCEGCRAFFVDHPDYYRPAEAKARALAALRLDGGHSGSVALTAAHVAANIGDGDEIRAVLQGFLEAAHREGDDARLLMLTKAMQELPR